MTIKYSQVTSRVNWLSGKKKTDVSRTISVLVFRVLMCLENQSASRTGLPKFHTHDAPVSDADCFSRHISTLKTRTEMVLETSVFLPLNQLTRLVAWEYFFYTMSPWKLQVINQMTSTLKGQALCFTETSVTTNKTTCWHDREIHNRPF
jgi:hypothetical protein